MWQKRGRKYHAKARAGKKERKKTKEAAFSLQQPLLSTFILNFLILKDLQIHFVVESRSGHKEKKIKLKYFCRS